MNKKILIATDNIQIIYYIFSLNFFVILTQFIPKQEWKNSNSWKCNALFIVCILNSSCESLDFLIWRNYSRIWNTWNAGFLFLFFQKNYCQSFFYFFIFVCPNIRDNQRCPWLVWMWQLCPRDYYAVVSFLRKIFRKILSSQSLPMYLVVLSPR